MARSRFFRAIAFAFMAGLAALLWLVLATPGFGLLSAAALFAVGSAVVHPLFVGERWRRSVRATLLAGVLGLPVLFCFSSPSATFALSLVILGLVRSAVLVPRPLARALAYELAFLGAGGVAVWMAQDGTPIGVVFAAWAFWLVQAGFVLMPSATSVEAPRQIDPFDRARAAAEAVLEGRPRH